jgi:hypothetical protein
MILRAQIQTDAPHTQSLFICAICKALMPGVNNMIAPLPHRHALMTKQGSFGYAVV